MLGWSLGPRNPALWSRELPSAKVGPYPNTSLGMLAAGYLLAGSWGEKKKDWRGQRKGQLQQANYFKASLLALSANYICPAWLHLRESRGIKPPFYEAGRVEVNPYPASAVTFWAAPSPRALGAVLVVPRAGSAERERAATAGPGGKGDESPEGWDGSRRVGMLGRSPARLLGRASCSQAVLAPGERPLGSAGAKRCTWGISFVPDAGKWCFCAWHTAGRGL